MKLPTRKTAIPRYEKVGISSGRNVTVSDEYSVARNRVSTPRLQVLLSVLILVRLAAAVQRRPLGVLLEEPHSLGVLIYVSTHISEQAWCELTFCVSVVKR